jgi:hypothetical protein
MVLLVAPLVGAGSPWSGEYSAQPLGVECSLLRAGDCPRVANADVHFFDVPAGTLALAIVDDARPHVGAIALAYDLQGGETARASFCDAGELALPSEAAEVVVQVDAAWRAPHCDGAITGTHGVVLAGMRS